MRKAASESAESVRSAGTEGDFPGLPARFNFARDVVHARATSMPEATALIGVLADRTVQRLTFARVFEASARLAAAMSAAGLRAGDRVLIFLPRTPHFQIALAACMHLGVMPVPCVTQITERELAYRAARCGARGAITADEFTDRFVGFAGRLDFRVARGGRGEWADLDRLLDTPAPIPPFAPMPSETPALIYFTSGSSGEPKAVVHAARGVFVRGWQPWHQLSMGPGDVIWTTSDTGWTRAGSCLAFGPWTHGATALIVEDTLTAADRLAVLEEFGVSFYGAVATELRQIMAQAPAHRLPRLRWTLSAGEAMTAELAQRWQEFSGAPLVVGYGQTETPTATLTDPSLPARNGMIGRPMAGNRLSVVGDAGEELGPGTEGEIVFDASDPGLLLGYWVGGAVVPSPRRGRWHLTGDCGFRDEAGDFYFVGRADDVIGSAGYRIGPTEVENALMRHPAVAECAVAASPDAERGAVVKAFVVARPGSDPEESLARELQEHVKREIAPYKYPRAIEFVRALPRTASGKISRRLLREAEFAKVR